MRITGAEHVNRNRTRLMSLLTSLAVAVTFFRFGAAHLLAQRDDEPAGV